MRSLSKIDKNSNLVVGLIPARWSSSRFEGKPLADIKGIPMIKRVYDRACLAKTLDTVVVLTDDERINSFCAKNEMRCIIGDDKCFTGTDRCARALDLIDGAIFVNIQGDEPLINPDAIDKLVETFEPAIGVSNACVPISEEYKLYDSNVVKVVFDNNYNAVYYSRLPIPFEKKIQTQRYQQLGLYAFSRHMLKLFSELPASKIEKAESVEMLRFIEHGFNVKMVEVEDEGLSVDTPDDLKLIEIHLSEYN